MEEHICPESEDCKYCNSIMGARIWDYDFEAWVQNTYLFMYN